MAFKSLKYWQANRDLAKRLYRVAAMDVYISIKKNNGLTKKERVRYEKENMSALLDFINKKTNECFIHTGVMVGTPIEYIEVGDWALGSVPTDIEIKSFIRNCKRSRTEKNKISYEKDLERYFNKSTPKQKPNTKKSMTAPAIKRMKGERNELGMLYEEDGSLKRGSIRTTLFESLTAFYCVTDGNLPFKKITQKHLEKNQSSVIANIKGKKITVAQCFDVFSESVFHSCYKQAQAIKKAGLVSSSSIISLDSGSKIGDTINQYIKEEMKGFNLPSAMNPNKWNTADIWISNKNINVKNLFANNLMRTNGNFVEALKKKELIGCSLKEIPNQRAARIEYTNIELSRKIYQYHYTSHQKVLVKENAFTNTSIEMTLNNIKGMRFTFFGKDGKIKIASQPDPGAAGGGGDFFQTVWDWMIRKLKINMPSSSDVNNFISKIRARDKRALEQLNSMIKSVDNINNYPIEVMIEQMEQRKKKDGELKVIDKCIAIYLAYEYLKLNKKDKDDIATEILLVAPAKSDWSGPFVKVY